VEKAKRNSITIYNCFIGFQKAFDSIQQDVIWATFQSFSVDEKLSTRMLKNCYDQSKSAVQIGSDIGEWFRTVVGTRQGDPISPTTFIAYLQRVMTALEEKEMAVSVNGLRVNNLRFADDLDLLETNRIDTFQENLEFCKGDAEKAGLKMLVFGQQAFLPYDLWLTGDQFVGKLSTMVGDLGQLIPLGLVNE